MKPMFRAEWVVVREELLILASCLLRPMSRNSVLEEFRVRRFAPLQTTPFSAFRTAILSFVTGKPRDFIFGIETDRNSVSVTVFRPKPPKNMVSAWFRLRQIGTVELRFRPKLDHVETETSRNWISSMSCSDLQSDDVIFQKQWAGLTVRSESSSSQCLFPTTDAVRGQQTDN